MKRDDVVRRGLEPPAATADAPSGESATPLVADSTTWTPEALEDLLAPIALYPDPVGA
ncbi:MAG: hypothetical protein ABI616_03160 [Pseudomonadota bacterium]